MFLRTTKKASSKQQELLTDNEPLQVDSNNIELLPTAVGSHDEAVEDSVRSHDATVERSHDATVEDIVRSHDATVAGNTEVSVTGISYRQLLQQDNIEYNRILDNEASDCESSVTERESEDESSKMLHTKQGMAKRTKKAFTSTFTVTLSILRYLHMHVHLCLDSHACMHT